ncbi:MAG: LytTR family DNA-binding domain-containing protein [Bacteroidota bacterium]
MKCVIIDDEPLARECIANYVREIDFLELYGSGNNPVDLTRMLGETAIDLVFLDIQMPVMNGIDFLKMTSNPPMIIITTAYPSYALESFQLDVLDYLLKPITFNRFFKAISKARNYHQLLQQTTTMPEKAEEMDFFFIKCDNKYERIYFEDILYIQAMQNYVTIYTLKGKYVTLLYLKNVEEKLDHRRFIRVHKSYIVAISKVEAIENNEIHLGDIRIPISRNHRDAVLERVMGGRLWRK